MRPLLVATALALVAPAALAQSPSPGEVIVFGDSSADLGSFGPETRPTNIGEMWSERLARRIGLSSTRARDITQDADGMFTVRRARGNSYALNGSTAQPFEGTFTLSDQIDFFVEDRTRFRSDDLVFVWITRNDITTAAAQGEDYQPGAFARALADDVDRLRSLGARDIVVFGAETRLLPYQLVLDIGATPESLEALRAATLASERAVWPLLAARDAFILDIDRLAEDVRAEPARYGFRFTTDSYQGRGDPDPLPSQAYGNDGNVFTADGHYTSAMQAIVADFALAQLRARELQASRLTSVDQAFSATHHDAAARASEALLTQTRTGQTWRVHGGVSATTERSEPNGRLASRTDHQGYALSLGASAMLGSGLLLGLEVSAERSDASIAGNEGDVERDSQIVTAYLAKSLGAGLSAEASVSAGWASVGRLERRALLGDQAWLGARGDTDGVFYAVRAGLQHRLDRGPWTLEAGTGLSVERTRLSAFSEEEGVLALSYGDAEMRSLRADLHTRLGYTFNDRVSVHVGARHVLDLDSDPLSLDVGPDRDSLATWSRRRISDETTSVALAGDIRLGDRSWIRAEARLDQSGSRFRRTAVGVSLVQSF